MQQQALVYISNRVCNIQKFIIMPAATDIDAFRPFFVSVFVIVIVNIFLFRDMSQAEQVPEDMPAYLNDESVPTGKCCSL